MNMTRYIGKYIREHSINIDSVSERTGVSVELLQEPPSRPMNATEFLEVCSYLKIRPEEITRDASLSL